ncbi:hypothetical protein FKG94_08630 [Exilibacterium tricleocarpae]|uniref:Uncharacterized protein n=1 Tax=Exilibacterium tricleocarpae TaxID=2591008 RepID=A0A545TVB5_9GAMM|nr:hypothetical protein [Exilibacterium tricleocarpae]TQV81165.1 hypothetical protein FKG94_08630 [Exilibacterium tricleocarpae]
MKSCDDASTICVPRGNGAIAYFELTPKLPEDGKHQKWQLDIIRCKCKAQHGEKCDCEHHGESIDSLDIQFCSTSSSYQCQYERCVLVVYISESAHRDWSFALGGIQLDDDPNSDDKNLYGVQTIMAANKRSMTAIVQSPGPERLSASFSFVAQHIDPQTRRVKIYASSDPAIGVGRGRDVIQD